MPPDESLLCDEATVARLITDLAGQVVSGRKAGTPLAARSAFGREACRSPKGSPNP